MKSILKYSQSSVNFWLLIASCWLMFTGFSHPNPDGELRIKVSNIYPVEGKLYVAVYDNADNYMDLEKKAFQKIVPVRHETELVVFDNIPEGEYAVSIFQDLDGNGELDKNSLGIPGEPYGFSNDARGTFGPPKFRKAKFQVTNQTTIKITLVNNEKE